MLQVNEFNEVSRHGVISGTVYKLHAALKDIHLLRFHLMPSAFFSMKLLLTMSAAITVWLHFDIKKRQQYIATYKTDGSNMTR